MGINVKHLLDRPCSVCEFHKENGCCKWSCVFEGEPIIDKVYAEIEQITDTMGVSYNQYVSKIDVLQILDKYKAETEE